MAPHSSTLAWKIPRMEEPGGLQSMGSQRVVHDSVTSLPLFTFMHWRRQCQPTPVFLPGEFQGRGSLVGCRLWGHTELDTTEATQQQQQQQQLCLPEGGALQQILKCSLHCRPVLWQALSKKLVLVVRAIGFYSFHSNCFNHRTQVRNTGVYIESNMGYRLTFSRKTSALVSFFITKQRYENEESGC